MSLPSWIEDRISEIATWSLDDQSRQWQVIAVIGELVDTYPRRSRERREIQALLTTTARKKKATQDKYVKLWRLLKADGEVWLPTNIDYSTALLLTEKGADIAVLRQANDESWTRTRARAWAIGMATVGEGKPLTLWRFLTRAIPPEWRKRTEALDDSLHTQLVSLVRTVAKEFGGE